MHVLLIALHHGTLTFIAPTEGVSVSVRLWGTELQVNHKVITDSVSPLKFNGRCASITHVFTLVTEHIVSENIKSKIHLEQSA